MVPYYLPTTLAVVFTGRPTTISYEPGEWDGEGTIFFDLENYTATPRNFRQPLLSTYTALVASQIAHGLAVMFDPPFRATASRLGRWAYPPSPPEDFVVRLTFSPAGGQARWDVGVRVLHIDASILQRRAWGGRPAPGVAVEKVDTVPRLARLVEASLRRYPLKC